MARYKIDFGIDLGTTNSAISKMENGSPKIIRTDVQKDTMPSSISVKKEDTFLVGDAGLRAHRKELEKKGDNNNLNSFIEFKRTIGTNKFYPSSKAKKNFTSEELSSEVLKKLKSFEQKEKIDAIVITIPAAFKQNQVDGTRRAADLAGFKYTELLQEPIAASMAYGLESKNKNGHWVVFDFGGGTFDSALVKVEDGIMKIIDTEGNNYLGGKNLDYAVVDEIIVPHIQDNFTINNLLQDDEKRNRYRTALKFHAEELKNQLSFKDEFNLYIDPGDAGEDDNGEEIEIDITLSRDQLREVLAPIYQKAIDSTKKLLQRNNIKGNDLDEIILVGGPTLSPIVQEMLSQQIKQPDTSMDPMTVVAKGAALHASTIDIPDNIKEKTRDRSKIQLDVSYESTSVEIEEYITIKTLPEKIEGHVPEEIFVELERNDGAWKSDKTKINETGDVIVVSLSEGKSNAFQIILTDEGGNNLECEPHTINILQGSKTDSSTLPYNIGIEVKDKDTGKVVFKTVDGLEKNKSLKATGKLSGLKNQKQLRPGNKSDFIKVPIYQGEHGADGTRAIYNEHVYNVIISGDDLPSLLPENTDIDITILVDRSQSITMKAYFTYLDYTTEVEVKYNKQSTETYWLDNEIKKAKSALKDLKTNSNADESKINRLEEKINELEKQFNQNKEDVDTKQEVLSNLRASLKEIDKEKEGQEWPQLEKQLKEAFYKLEKVNDEKGNDQTNRLVEKYKNDVENVIQTQDKKITPQLIEDINSLAFELERLEHLIGFVLYLEQDFDNIKWKDSNSARGSINQAKGVISNQPSIQKLQPIVNDLFHNAGFDKQKPSGSGVDDSVLIG